MTKRYNQIMDKILFGILFLFCALILGLTLRGLPGNPTSKELNSSTWKDNGPFELSPERGRFALAYSIIEDRSLQFSNDIGNFADPDVAVSNGRFVSLFAPAVSFLIAPGYILGKYFGISQVGSFAVISFFALVNVLLLRSVAIKLGANKIAATVASLTFLFATPAFAYAVDLYQHHISTFLILLSIYAILNFKTFWSLLVVFFLCAFSIPLDYPNLFFMFPIGAYALFKAVTLEQLQDKFKLKINIPRFLTLLIMIIPILFFLWFNKASFGNPFQLSGTLPTSKVIIQPNSKISASGLEAGSQLPIQTEDTDKRALTFFKTRDLINGFYILFLSPDRGMVTYTPIMISGLLGFILAFRKKVVLVPLLGAIMGANILLYSMWGDPWGGWAFGSRYLIPSYAILSIFIGLLLTYWRKKILFLVLFFIVLIYSISVNTLGAITSSANPPQAEVLALEKVSGIVQKYTYERNWDSIVKNNSKSFVFKIFADKYLTAEQYYFLIVALISIPALFLTIFLPFSSNRRKNV